MKSDTFQDPEVSAALQDISSNPANIAKYQDNPKIKSIIEKMTAKFGGAKGGPFGGGAGGPFGGGAGGPFDGADGSPGSFPPQPDID